MPEACGRRHLLSTDGWQTDWCHGGILQAPWKEICVCSRQQPGFGAEYSQDPICEGSLVVFLWSASRRSNISSRMMSRRDFAAQMSGGSRFWFRNCYAMPTKRSPDGGDRYILWVSTIRKLKRAELFLDLAQALPNYQFRMIGGPGDDEAALFESIKARASAMANVQFLGFVPFSRTEEQFDQATLFVNTSDSEGFPNTFLQAWARGIPTVSFVDAGARLDGKPIGRRVSSIGRNGGHSCGTGLERLNTSEGRPALCRHMLKGITHPRRLWNFTSKYFKN